MNIYYIFLTCTEKYSIISGGSKGKGGGGGGGAIGQMLPPPFSQTKNKQENRRKHQIRQKYSTAAGLLPLITT